MFVTDYVSPEKQIQNSTGVRCPVCGTEFQSSAIRFFGIFTPTGMRNLLVIVLLLVFASWIYFGFFLVRR
jgi:hypothetical protein